MSQPPKLKKPGRSYKIGCIAVVLLVGSIFVACLSVLVTETPDQGEHVSHVDWLPAEANDVSFYRSYSWTAYEFSISDAGFRKWAADNRWPVQMYSVWPWAIGRYWFQVRRNTAATQPATQPVDPFDPAVIAAAAQDYKRPAKGWHYGQTQSNGGGVYVGYDIEQKRAYYQYSPR